MPYYASERPVPAGFQTNRLLLEPLRPRHVERDYEAVMESREQLRLWSGSPWPQDDFTVEDNLKDLQWHWEEHQKRIAFTYTVLDPTRQTCLGCVYMRPLSELAPFNPANLTGVAADESLVRFWVRTSQLKGDLEQHLLRALIQWLKAQWSFSRVLFETREANTRQLRFFDDFLMQRAMSLLMAERGGRHMFYDPFGRSRTTNRRVRQTSGARSAYPRLPRDVFEALIVEALADLPVYFQEQLQNIEILVDDWAGAQEHHSSGIHRGSLILGLYHGVPLTNRTSGYQLVAPDTITLYQGPIEMVSGGDYERIRAQVKHTVIHEIAHHFGISDDRLRELGAY